MKLLLTFTNKRVFRKFRLKKTVYNYISKHLLYLHVTNAGGCREVNVWSVSPTKRMHCRFRPDVAQSIGSIRWSHFHIFWSPWNGNCSIWLCKCNSLVAIDRLLAYEMKTLFTLFRTNHTHNKIYKLFHNFVFFLSFDVFVCQFFFSCHFCIRCTLVWFVFETLY